MPAIRPAEANYVNMPPAYRPRFFAGLVAYQTTQLQQAMGYSQDVAHDLAYRQIQGIQQDDAGLPHRHLVAAKWKKNIIGGAWYVAVPERASSLLWIMIEDAHQGQGHGRRLLAHVAEQARAAGATGLVLHVFTANTVAVTLYQKLGFSDIGKEMFLPW
ncbi:GNAT family N-acetyltransferase [Acidithiobacillus ferridurans]|uniref:Putative N-acetyltransferase YycN n=1 Tax=Acidithiobacillus ferridurans TaxID=1232575 RepID=A0A2Z6IFR0_ACIFI|nr:GNAT family N-acetyltransferase [Acidithiobacillus ferridurans]BBF64452.1 putative N-acetyltransferase YycN [Acidithiobacillus ferridurans]